MANNESQIVDLSRLSDKFKIERELGEGAFGVVYLAKDISNEQQVALKRLPLQKRDDALREYNILKDAGCGKGVACYRGLYSSTVRGEDYIFIEIDYYNGKNVADYIEDGGTFSIAELVAMYRRLLKALLWLHDRRVIHHDIKSQNIIITPAGPVIIDFGLSCRLEESETSLYHCHLRSGTPNVSPPEIGFSFFCVAYDELDDLNLLFSKDIYYKSDIWSLGLVFKDMLETQANVVTYPFSCESIRDEPMKKRWLSWLRLWKNLNEDLLVVDSLYNLLNLMIEGMLKEDYKLRISLLKALELLEDFEKEM